MEASSPRISVSIVSHRHGQFVADLLEDLDRHRAIETEVLLTLNVDEDLPFDPARFHFPIRVIRNPQPRGFGENHNAAFKLSQYELFCVLNPDIRLPTDPFPGLIGRLRDPRIAVAAPLVHSPKGVVEASARPFPTPLSILRKALFGPSPPDYAVGLPDLAPDWVGGMFMLLPREAFAMVGGFDERYHLYYEDVDLCARLRLAEKEITFCPTIEVIHSARRDSHRSPRYFAWHVVSMLRFFLSAPFWRLVIGRRISSTARTSTRR